MNKTFCEFFAGIGLVREALEATGWQCTYANDIAPKKSAMYRRRFESSDCYHEGDVWETETVIQQITSRPYLATASFPCTDMSLAGRREGFAGSESSSFFGFARVIECLEDRRPQLLLLENVVGFLNSRDGADFQAAAEALAQLGYYVDALILDAKRFVPQSRPRLFLLGFHESADWPEMVRQSDAFFGDRWSALLRSSGDLRNERLRRLMEATQLPTGWATLPLKPPPQRDEELIQYLDVDEQQPWWDEPLVTKHLDMMTDTHRAEVEAWRGGDDVQVATVFRRIRQGRQRAEVRRDGLAGCLRTPRGGSARQIVVAAGQGRIRMRWMTAREYARLQGAPEFPLGDSANQSLFGFGDAVCVPVIRWIDNHILTPLHQADAVGSSAR